MKEIMGLMDILSAFNVAIHVPMLNSADIRQVFGLLLFMDGLLGSSP